MASVCGIGSDAHGEGSQSSSVQSFRSDSGLLISPSREAAKPLNHRVLLSLKSKAGPPTRGGQMNTADDTNQRVAVNQTHPTLMYLSG